MKENQNNQNNDNQSKQVLLSVLAVAILVVAVVGVSFAAFTYTKTGEKENTVTTGTITMEYTENDNAIEITDAMPVTEEVGKAITPDSAGTAGETTTGHGVFDFTVKATISGQTTINYEVAAEKVEVPGPDPAQLGDQYIRLYLQKDEAGGDSYTEVDEPKAFTANGTGASGVGTPESAMVLDSGSFTATKTVSYRLRMWVDSSYVVTGTKSQYKVKVNVYGKAV